MDEYGERLRCLGEGGRRVMCRHKMQGLRHRGGRYSRTWRHKYGLRSPASLQTLAEDPRWLLITSSTSEVAACCSSASFSSRVSRATSVSLVGATRTSFGRIAALCL